MRLCNEKIKEFLKSNPNKVWTASTIIARTGLAPSTVYENLKLMRKHGLADRSLDVGVNGNIIHQWYWCGDWREPI